MRPRWAVPLCRGTLAHWVLGFVDREQHRLGIFNSIPELNSEKWAKPVRTFNDLRAPSPLILKFWLAASRNCRRDPRTFGQRRPACQQGDN